MSIPVVGVRLRTFSRRRDGRRSADGAEQRLVRRQVLAQRALELRVDLADAALGDAEDLADLAQREVLDVEEHRDLALALGQRLERAAELVLGLGALRGLLRVAA